MIRSIPLMFLALLFVSVNSLAAQQAGYPIPAETGVRKPPSRKLSGPRVGMTFFTGDVADYRAYHDLSPVMSQFGWQFETQIMSSTEGHQALMEWLFLLGGLEQNETSFTAAWLAGYRLANGIEFGVGPSLNINPGEGGTNTSMVVATGATLPFGGIYIPLNMAVSFSNGGPRITTLVGWVVG